MHFVGLPWRIRRSNAMSNEWGHEMDTISFHLREYFAHGNSRRFGVSHHRCRGHTEFLPASAGRGIGAMRSLL